MIGAVEDQFGRICVPNKVEIVTLKVVNMMKRINELKTLAKDVSFECRSELVWPVMWRDSTIDSI